MKNFAALAVLVALGGFGWQVGATADTETIALFVGFVFGALAAVPASLITLVAVRRREPEAPPPPRQHRYDDYGPMVIMPPAAQHPAAPPQQTPPWTVTGGGAFDDLPAQNGDRRFRVR